MEAGPGRTVLQDTDALYQAGVLDDAGRGARRARRSPRRPTLVDQRVRRRGLGAARPRRPRRSARRRPRRRRSSRSRRLRRRRVPGRQRVRHGGERYPKISDSLDFLAFFHKPHYAVVEVAPLVPTRTEPGRAPAAAVIDDDPASTSTCTWSATSAPAASRRSCSRSAPVVIFLTLCWLLHRRDRVVVANRSAGPRTRRRSRLSRWASTCPIVRADGPGRGVRRHQLRRVAPAGPAPAVGGQGGAVRVRHRAQPRAAGALPGQLLHRRHAVHHVRHRDHLRVPVRRRPLVRSASTASWRSSSSRRCSS